MDIIPSPGLNTTSFTVPTTIPPVDEEEAKVTQSTPTNPARGR
ncbi:MAG: hypothetical protein N2320_02905 [Candidatus Bipolaricaulota bacterium]|nr:hypothetical protein [Candidatus Bipolaricaulota bacterium]